MPPLRRRRADIPLLAAHFVEKICRIEEIPLKFLLPEAVEHLGGYFWPGNVRQLENSVKMAVVLSGERPVLRPSDFPLPEPLASKTAMADMPLVSVPDDGLDYDRTLAVIERSILEQALRETGGNKKAAAKILRDAHSGMRPIRRRLEPRRPTRRAPG